jgi:hypothetical protein
VEPIDRREIRCRERYAEGLHGGVEVAAQRLHRLPRRLLFEIPRQLLD